MNEIANRRAARRAAAASATPGVPTRRRRASLQNGNRKKGGLRSRLPRRRGLRIALIIVSIFSGLGLFGVAVVYAEYQHYRGQLPDAATLASMEPPLEKGQGGHAVACHVFPAT